MQVLNGHCGAIRSGIANACRQLQSALLPPLLPYATLQRPDTLTDRHQATQEGLSAHRRCRSRRYSISSNSGLEQQPAWRVIR